MTDHSAPTAAIGYRRVLGHFATGVTVVTAVERQTARPMGIAVNSFTSVSLDPPLACFCIGNSSTSWPSIRAAPSLCVNILGHGQRGVCVQMASVDNGDKFRGVPWTSSPGGSPILAGAVAWLDGRIRSEYPAGDHTIVVVEVVHFAEESDAPPLVFLRGQYGRFRV
jgi:3-hydroxy-9,10-secoandrosta-1,3,5(10)-triene-9,17-dione monooxygenase reductase component